MQVTLENCTVKIHWMGTEQDWQIHEYCHYKCSTRRRLRPLVEKGRKKSKSPRSQINDNATTSVRYCLDCCEQRMFIHKTNQPHSHCEVCGSTHSSRGKLRTKMNKVFCGK